MQTLYNWNAKRAGGKITVTHSAGKVAGVDKIEPRYDAELGHHIVATVDGGNLTETKEFVLGVGAAG